MNKLYNEYRIIEPEIKFLFVEPSIYNNDNEYLELLYEKIITEIPVKSLSKYKYPLLFIYKILGKKFIIHHHWFESNSVKSSFVVIWKLFWLFLLKMVGGKIIWTIHNKYPHNMKLIIFNRITRIFMAKISTKLHVHCHNALEIMSNILRVNKDKFFIVQHPNYKVEIYEKQLAIEKFNIKYSIKINYENKIFLVFGQMAKYKGIKELLEIFNSVDENYTLILAGKIKAGNDNYIEQIKNFNKNLNIKIIDKFIPKEDVSIFFNMSDLVVFNYTEILTSGGVVLSLNYNKKTIAPSKACISEIKDENLLIFNNENELVKIIKENIK